MWLNATLVRGYTVGCGGSGCGNVIIINHYGLYATDAAMGSMNVNDPVSRPTPPATPQGRRRALRPPGARWPVVALAGPSPRGPGKGGACGERAAAG